VVGRVDVTWIDMDATSAPVAEYWQTLDRDERTRANRFRFAKDQRRFIVRRGALRALLASRLDCPAWRIRYSRNKFGKLSVVASDIRFNVSCSHSLALYALARGVEVGCDVERVDPRFDFEELAKRYFAPQEIANLQSLPATLRRAGFFWHWTLKEAYVKCRGVGLTLPLDSFAFSLAPDGTAVLQGADDFICASIEPMPGYQAALVAQANSMSLQVETHAATKEERANANIGPS